MRVPGFGISRICRNSTTVVTRRRLKGLKIFVGLFCVVVTMAFAGIVPNAKAAVGINPAINFQGKLTNPNGTNIANGSYSFVFSLYSAASGGSAIWTETDSLTLTDGIFQVNLGPSAAGANTNFANVDFNSDSLYLGIKVGADAEMSPRVQFTSTPYAFNAGKLGGIAAAGFAQLNPASAQSGSLNVTGSVQAATSLQAPLVDTATAVALNIGTSTASSVTLGRTGTTFTVQGGPSSTISSTNGSFTTTVGFTATTGSNKSISFPDAGGTLCTTTASTCSATYQTASPSGSYLQKNATDTSAASVAAAGYLYSFSNSNVTPASGGVLSLSNGTNTGSTLSVTAAGNPGASQALILANNTNGTPSGNLIDLQVVGTSKFSVNSSGNLITAGTISSGLINSQTISAVASFTGTVTAVTGFYAPILSSSDTATASTNSSAVIFRSGNATGATSTSGNVTVDSGTGTTSTGSVNVGTGNASAVTLGKAGTTTTNNGTLQIGASAGSGALVNNGSTVNTTYAMANLPTGGWDAGGAATTVDKYTYISAAQTTAGQTLTIPTPTANTTYGRILYLTNTGTASFTTLGTIITAGSTATLVWANTNGGATWTFAGVDGSGILNQNSSDQTANFRISGTGRANTSLTTPLVDSIAGALGIGTNTATAITLGGATTTGTIAIGTAAASTLNIGTGAFAHTIAIGTDATTVQGLILGSPNSTSATTLQAGSGNINLNAATVATNQATLGLFTTPTTINEFTAATAINEGAANAVVTYGNGGAATLRSTTGALTITSAAASTFSTGAGVLTVQGFGGTTINTPNASGAVTSNISVASGNVTSGAFASGNIVVDAGSSTGTTGTITIGGTSASALAIGRTGVITTLNGTAQIGASAGNGAVVNNGSTVNTVYPMANLATGGWDAGGAAATIDKYTYISAAQTTAGQTLTIPAPTANTTYGRLLYLTNNGTASFTLLGTIIGAGSTATLVYANTNGGATWTFAGADGSGILNQNTLDQTANFRVTGTGRANTSFTSPLFDSISGGLNLGTSTATGVTIGSTTNTTGITLQGSAGATISIGNAAGSGLLTNNGATLNTTLALGDFASGGAIGTAAATVNIYTSFSIAQTTVGQSLTVPAPTANTQYGRLIYISNVGTTSFNYSGVRIPGGSTATLIWSNTNGAASWQFAGAGASSIENQNTSSQAADFRINGSGQADTSFLTPTLDTAAAGTLSLGVSSATSISLGKSTITTTNNGTLQVGASAGTGALVNNGSTVNTTYAMANLASGGWDAGGAAATVDKYTYISASQTTVGQTLTIPSPTASTTYGRLLYLTNIGTTSFSLLGATIGTGSTATLVWANTNGGASWTYAGADASGILNQNTADQTANFRISGSGRANTSITTPLVDSITGGLNLGTTTATGVTIGGTTNTTGITLQGAAGVTITIGNAAGSGVLTNNGATLNTTLALGNFATGGSIGTAAATVNVYSSISVAQTTVGQALTIPAPTVSTVYGRQLYISNIGTTSFNLSNVRIPPGNTATLIWSNTSGGASWQFAGAGASSIENQNASSQAADFRINGSGQADTSFLTPSLDVASAGTLSVGATTATGVNIGNTTNTTAINLRVTAAGTVTIANLVTVSASSGIIQIGSSTSNANTTVFALNNNNGTTTPTEVDGGMYYNNSTSQFLCGENGFWVNCGVPPRDHSYDLYDEFMSGNSGSLVTGAYGIGSLNWYNSLIGAPGALTYNNNAVGGNAPAATVDRPGIMDIQQTGTGNGTGQTMSLGLGSMKLGTSLLDLKTAVNITGSNLTVLLGLHNETTAVTAPTTGVYWKEASNGLWQYCYANATPAEICANSAVTATANTWARLEIVIVSATEIDYYINGTKIAVTGITYNTTNKVSPAYTSWKSTGTPGTLDVYIDYFELLGTTTTAR